MTENHSASRSPSKAVWIVAYLVSPALAFVCLRYARAIGTFECICGVLGALIAQIGLVTVLGATDGDPLQIFVTVLLGLSIFVVVLWQFLAGQRAGLWSAGAQKQWRIAGRCFGGFIAVGLALGIVTFHLRRHLDPEHSGNENPQAEHVGGGNGGYGALVEYRCEIPEGLDKKFVLTAKDGSESKVDAHQIYRNCHRLEWFNAVRRHLIKGEIPIHLMFREDVQEWRIYTVARTAGMMEAELMISKASLIHEPDDLYELLRQLLSKEERQNNNS
jgi:hypothetical protein